MMTSLGDKGRALAGLGSPGDGGVRELLGSPLGWSAAVSAPLNAAVTGRLTISPCPGVLLPLAEPATAGKQHPCRSVRVGNDLHRGRQSGPDTDYRPRSPLEHGFIPT